MSEDCNETVREVATFWKTVPDHGTTANRAITNRSLTSPTINVSARPVRTWLHAELSMLRAACGAFEWIALLYLLVSALLIVIFAENLAHPARWVCVQLAVAVAILFLCRLELRTSQPAHRNWNSAWEGKASVGTRTAFSQRTWHFWRHWYPHLFFLFCFEELGRFVHLVSPAWQDAKLIAFDHWLTGVHPTIWLEQFATPARNDFMQFAYLTYFLYLVMLGGVLYYRKDWTAYWSVMTYSMAGYSVGYLVAIFFPIQSPWFSMAGEWRGDLHGGAITSVIHFIEHYGRVRGAAFPSEHVAGSMAALWGAWRHKRWLFWVMLPLVICMCVSTVWGRYHYVADVFAGALTGTLGYIIGKYLMCNPEAVPASDCALFATKTLRNHPQLALKSGTIEAWQEDGKVKT